MDTNNKYPKDEVSMHWSGGRKCGNGRQQKGQFVKNINIWE
jgi:hypothetical protein